VFPSEKAALFRHIAHDFYVKYHVLGFVLAGPVHDEELNLARILLTVVLIFIVCQSVKLVPDVYQFIFCSPQEKCDSTWTIEYIIACSHCLLAVNSSVNFFVYIMRGGEFRDVILQIFKSDPQGRSSPMRATYANGEYRMVAPEPMPVDAMVDANGRTRKRLSPAVIALRNERERGFGEAAVREDEESPKVGLDKGNFRVESALFLSQAENGVEPTEGDSGICAAMPSALGHAGEAVITPKKEDLRWPFTMYDIPTVFVREDNQRHGEQQMASERCGSPFRGWRQKREMETFRYVIRPYANEICRMCRKEGLSLGIFHIALLVDARRNGRRRRE